MAVAGPVNGRSLVFSWSPGMGGDMIRACLLPLITPGKWEFKPCDEAFYNWNGLAEIFRDPIKGWKGMGLYWEDELINFIDWRGQAQMTAMNNKHRWDDPGPNSPAQEICFQIHKRHHSETYQPLLDEIMEEAESERHKDVLYPVVTFVTVNDLKYQKLAQKNWLMKTSVINSETAEEISWWDNEHEKTIEQRLQTPEEANKVFFDMYDRKHCFWMDTIYQWDSFKQELKNYLGFYDIMYIDNFDIVKQFWQQWIDEQRIKVE